MLLSFPVMTRKELATLLHMRLSCTWSQAAQLGDQAEEKYQEMCGDCCLVSPTFCPCSGMGDFVSVSPFSSSYQIAWCAEVFLPVSPLSLSQSLSFTRLSPCGIPCWREMRVRWVCGRTGQCLREMTVSVIDTERGVPQWGAVYNMIPQQLLQLQP